MAGEDAVLDDDAGGGVRVDDSGGHACLTCDAQTYDVSGPATPAGISQVHALLAEARAEHPEICPHDLFLFETAMIELANNVVEHGQPPGEVQWRVILRVSPRALEAEMIDTSGPVTFTAGRPMPDLDATSGRGIPIIEAALDYLLLSRIGDENHWLLLRLLPG